MSRSLAVLLALAMPFVIGIYPAWAQEPSTPAPAPAQTTPRPDAFSDPIPPVAGTPVKAEHFSYIDTKIGTGPKAAPSQYLTIHWRCWKADGTPVSSTYASHNPTVITYDQKMILAHLGESFDGMRVGGKRRIFLTTWITDPDKEVGPQPASTSFAFVFDAELIAVTDGPGFVETGQFLKKLLEHQSGTTISLIEPDRDGRHHMINTRIEEAHYDGCTLVMTKKSTVDGSSDSNGVWIHLGDLDPSTVRFAPTKSAEGWRAYQATYTVKAASSQGGSGFSEEVDSEEDAGRLQRALAHAIALCGGSKSLF